MGDDIQVHPYCPYTGPSQPGCTVVAVVTGDSLPGDLLRLFTLVLISVPAGPGR
ncbi:hypothetical protein [Actinoplanes sp. TFC3]|uniref:hypothetical protein n=1 Tax=Actinoplanes sp. TFC3 TaxID=1710355 RepID=UPI000AE5D43B|nr:hypothetical protein [Actinoplanes sp. TFC3]